MPPLIPNEPAFNRQVYWCALSGGEGSFRDVENPVGHLETSASLSGGALKMTKSVLFWRRIDVEGLERLELAIEPEGVTAMSTVVCLEGGGFRLDHRWRLDPDWRAQPWSAGTRKGMKD